MAKANSTAGFRQMPTPILGLSALSAFSPHPGRQVRPQEQRMSRLFGGPADSGSPVALRPPLARGLPFRLLSS